MFDWMTYVLAILGGKPIMKGKFISVECILELFGSFGSTDDIVRNDPFLSVSTSNDRRVLAREEPSRV